MELLEIYEALSRPEAYPCPVLQIEVRHTHISVVFLAGPYAYKVKKPVNLGFLDFGSLEKRRHFCEQEVKLNRRLSPSVYLGVVAIARTSNGIQLESPGEVVEWAVKMERLPATATLAAFVAKGMVSRAGSVSDGMTEPVAYAPGSECGHSFGSEAGAPGEILPTQVTALAKRVARFHAEAETNSHISSFGRLEVVAQNAQENFDQAEPLVGVTLSRTVFNRLKELCDEALADR